jgi:hypothetical protein
MGRPLISIPVLSVTPSITPCVVKLKVLFQVHYPGIVITKVNLALVESSCGNSENLKTCDKSGLNISGSLGLPRCAFGLPWAIAMVQMYP